MDQAPGNPDQSADASGPPGCYRHPDRATGVRCTRCERPICPACMVSASVGFQCPNCVKSGSGTGHAPDATRPRTVAGGSIVTGDPRLLTKILIGINIAVFFAVLGTDDRLVTDLALIGRFQDYFGAPLEGVSEGQWYRLLTSMFLHQEPWHIAFNMLGLWWLGGPLEAAFGRARYLTLYLLSGLAGSALTYLLEAPNQASLGASGAVFGLLGATVVLVRRLNYEMRPVLTLLALNLLFTFWWANIAWQAHVGGLVAGIVIAYGMVHAPRERRTLVQVGACALVILATAALVVARTAELTG
jgi:membrane associated rhomboid family serine protease